MDEPDRKGEELRVMASPDPVVRVVLAELDAPGPLHYLIEAEGFQVIGCASDEIELGRVLQQDVYPDVIVLDADISATSVLVAHEQAPSARVIVIWPDGVLLPRDAERVAPWLVYEQLGPTIRHAVQGRLLRRANAAETHAERRPASIEPLVTAEDSGLGRAASRVSVTSILLVAAIVLTMGASFALEGWNVHDRQAGPSRPSPTQSTAPARGPMGAPATDQRETDARAFPVDPCATPGASDRTPPNDHASSAGHDARSGPCQRAGGGATNKPEHPSGPPSNLGSSNDGGGNGGAGAGDQGGGSQGDQGGEGNQGDQAGGEGGGDQGGGDPGTPGGDQGDQADQGGDQGTQNDDQGKQAGSDSRNT